VQFGTHVVGPLALVREALPSLRASRGHVFMLGSGVARVPVGGLGAYPPSKAALRSATAVLRREVAPLEIAVTYVDPGAVDTAFMHRAGLAGAPPNMLVSPELVARKILLAIGTRPRVLNVAPLQTVVVSIAELFPALTDAVLTRNPALVGGGPTLAAIDVLRDGQGRGEKIALPATPPLPLAAATETLEPFPLQGDIIVSPPPAPPAPPEPPPLATLREEHADAEAAVAEPPPPPVRWTFEPPEEASEPVATATLVRTDDDEEELEDEVVFSEPEEPHHAPTDDEPARATSSFDAAIESLRRRMDRAKLDPGFVRGLLVKDAVIDVHEVAMRWAGMPNKHERALTSEVFFALSEWGFLAPRADGRYRVLLAADEEPEG